MNGRASWVRQYGADDGAPPAYAIRRRVLSAFYLSISYNAYFYRSCVCALRLVLV